MLIEFYSFSVPASSLPLGINAHPNPNVIGESHKKLGIHSRCFFSFSSWDC